MSEFDQVLYMDADNIALTANVCRLFDTSEDYARTGALLWQDFWSSSAAPDLFDVLPSSPALDFNGTHESGQFLVHKSRVWRALALALFMNAYPEIFSPLSGNYMGWGDKEFLASALAATKTPFARVSRLPQHVGVAVHDRISIWGNVILLIIFISFQLLSSQVTPCSSSMTPTSHCSCTPTSAKSSLATFRARTSPRTYTDGHRTPMSSHEQLTRATSSSTGSLIPRVPSFAPFRTTITPTSPSLALLCLMACTSPTTRVH